MKRAVIVLLAIVSLIITLLGYVGEKKVKGDLLEMSNKLVDSVILGETDGIEKFVPEGKSGEIAKVIDTELIELVEACSNYSLDIDSEALNNIVNTLKRTIKNVKYTTEIIDQYESGAFVKLIIESLDIKQIITELDREIKAFNKATEETVEDYSEVRKIVSKKYFEILNVKLQLENVGTTQKTLGLLFKVEYNRWKYKDLLDDVKYILKNTLTIY